MNQDPELHVCVCQSGFFGRRCEKHVPCEVSSCENNGTCVNTIDGDACYCPPGFTGGSLAPTSNDDKNIILRGGNDGNFGAGK